MTENRLPPAPPPLAIIAPMLVVATVVAFYFAFSAANLLAIVLIVLAPVVFVLLGNIGACLMTLLVLTGATLYVPGFPSEFTLLDLFLVCVVVLLLGHQCARKSSNERRMVPPVLVFAMFALLLLTMCLRGLGFQELGGSRMGGMTYVRILFALLLYLLPKPVVLTTRQWRAALIGYCLIAFVPPLVDLTFIISGGRIYHFYYLVRPQGGVPEALNVLESGEGIFRVKRLPGSEVLLLALVLFPWRRGFKILICCTGLLAILFAGLTGYRLRLLDLMLFVGILLFMVSRHGRIRLALKLAAGGASAFLLLLLVASDLPLPIQRTISWVPFVDVSYEATASALATTRWRLELWREMLRMLPDYWLIGRGFAFEESVSTAVQTLVGLDRHHVGWALMTHNYHNGPLGLLLDLGVFGLGLVLAIVVVVTLRYHRLTQQEWQDPYLAWLQKLLFAKFAASVFVFLFIYGDMRNTLPGLLIAMTFLECMTDSLRRGRDAKTALPVASTET